MSKKNERPVSKVPMLYIRIKKIVELLLIWKNFSKCNEESCFIAVQISF